MFLFIIILSNIFIIQAAKIVQTSAKKVYFQFAECRLSSAKIVQTSAKKVYFQFAECRLSSAKIVLFRFPDSPPMEGEYSEKNSQQITFFMF